MGTARPGAIHALQPNEGPDFVRFAFHATDGRRLDLVGGDGLDDVLHDPTRGLRLWTGDRDIAPGELMVGRRSTGETRVPRGPGTGRRRLVRGR